MKFTSTPLKAQFPYFGGKSKVASLVWERLGKVANYIEPFFGSGAVLLARPHPPNREAVNDWDCYLANYWRSVKADPEAVVEYADWPVNEVDLHSRHRWLVLGEDAAGFRERMRTDPDFYNPKFAGWWVWGLSMWIGSGWCGVFAHEQRRPNLKGNGVNVTGKRPKLKEAGVNSREALLWEQMPASEPRGVNMRAGNRPQLGDAFDIGRGVHRNHNAKTCEQRRAFLLEWTRQLSDRLRLVRVCCGDWLRVCNSPTVTTRLGLTGLFLDPPYPDATATGEKSRDSKLYNSDLEGGDINELRDRVLAYCMDRGSDPMMRIAVCGYDTDGYAALETQGWQAVAWEANGGYSNRSGKGKTNARRERIWFSPHCLQPETERGLFDA